MKLSQTTTLDPVHFALLLPDVKAGESMTISASIGGQFPVASRDRHETCIVEAYYVSIDDLLEVILGGERSRSTSTVARPL